MDFGASSSGRHKRKRNISDYGVSDDDSSDPHQAQIDALARGGQLFSEPIDNEYEDLDEDEDLDENGDQQTVDLKEILEAQQPATISKYDDIKITPFNLAEELEEGKFDKAGNFIASKKESEDEDNNDTWAESVDWAAIERKEREDERASKINKKPSPSIQNKLTDSEQNRPDAQVVDRVTCYKQMLRIMIPDETVQKTIRRLGNSVPKRRPIKPKAGKPNESPPVESGDLALVAEAKRKLDSMIELAHLCLEGGDIDIYQKSFEDLEEAIN